MFDGCLGLINTEPSCTVLFYPGQAVYEDGLRSLAELTSTSVELFRKMAELTLLPQVSWLHIHIHT